MLGPITKTGIKQLCFIIFYLSMLSFHVWDEDFSLCKQAVALPAGPSRAGGWRWDFFGKVCPITALLCRGCWLLLSLLEAVDRAALLVVVVVIWAHGISRFGAEREIDAQVWRAFDGLQGAMHGLERNNNFNIKIYYNLINILIL